MIIVSQDKYNILNFDTTINIGVEEISTLNDIVQISAQTNGNTIIIGKYETEERAKEVLQEIIQAKTDFEYYKYADQSERNELDPFMKTHYNFFNTYEMPLE